MGGRGQRSRIDSYSYRSSETVKNASYKSIGTTKALSNINTILTAWNERNTTGRNDPPVVRFAKAYQEFINTGKASDIRRATDVMMKGEDARDAFSKLAASRFISEQVAEIYEKIFKK